MWTGEVELVDERDLRIGCWQGNCLPPTSLSLKDSASQGHSSVNPCATKGRLAAPPVQEYKRSRMLQLKGWIPEAQNAAVEGNSQRLVRMAGWGGARGWKAVEILESAVTIFVFTVKWPGGSWTKGNCCSGEVAITSSRSWILLVLRLRNTACCSTCQHCMWCQYFVYSVHGVPLSFPVWIILSDDFALRVSKLQNCDFLLCKTEYKILDTGFYTERMRLILHLLKPS